MHFRNFYLSENEVFRIANCFETMDLPFKNAITSISFSYNKNMGDEGIALLAQQLPKKLVEIGLVGIGISDKGGEAILHWAKQTASLRMICVEKNNFSKELKQHFYHLVRKTQKSVWLCKQNA